MTLLYFAWVRQKTGKSEEQFTLPPEIRTVRELAAFLAARGGGYEHAFGDEKRLRVAVGQAHADWDAPVSDADEVAFFPPVTGG
jgi:molybdopterin synthase sulfur carrier subunit